MAVWWLGGEPYDRGIAAIAGPYLDIYLLWCVVSTRVWM